MTPDPTGAEYNRSYGLGAIHAAAAYEKGATGAGITVAVIDSGVNPAQPDLVGNVSAQSTDLYTSRNAPNGETSSNVFAHGTFIAGVIASKFNGQGTIGVAYNSTILGIRADTPGSCSNTSSPDSGCTFDDNVLARGVSYAISHGARIINLSVGGSTPSSPDFEAALSQAVTHGIVVTASAGNESTPSPDWPAMYAVDARYKGFVIAVGATNRSNVLASYSNQAGPAAAGYVVAPGGDSGPGGAINGNSGIVSNCDSTSCWDGAGTSFSSPHVAGALALLLQAFPNLSGQQAIQILEQTADDLGAPGVDPVYGNGLIDMAKAFAPVGTMSVPLSATRSAQALSFAGSSLGPAFGDAVRRTVALTTVGFDSYRRMFAINLADGFPSARQSLVAGVVGRQVTDSQMEVRPAGGVRFALTAGATGAETAPRPGSDQFHADPFARSDLNLELDAGRFSFSAWRGEGGLAPAPQMTASSNAFALLARPERAMRAAYSFAGMTVSGEAGQGGQRQDGQLLNGYGAPDVKPASYALASLAVAHPRWAAAVSAGRLNEPQGPLGSWLPDRTSFALSSSTAFAQVHADWAASARLVLSFDAGMGRTIASGPFLTLAQSAVSSNWRLSARTRCANPARDCTGFTLSLAQPVRVESGAFSTLLANVPDAYDDPLTYSRRNFSAAPSGREIDLSLGVSQSWRHLGDLQLDVIAVRDQGNVAGPMSLGLIAGWRTRF